MIDIRHKTTIHAISRGHTDLEPERYNPYLPR
jgi:hypothetical protein